MADRRTRAEKLAAMAAARESPHEAEIAKAKLARWATLPDFTATPKRGRHLRGFAPAGHIVVVFVDDIPEEAVVDDYGPFAGVAR